MFPVRVKRRTVIESSRPKRRLFSPLLIASTAFLVLVSACSKPKQLHINGPIMGTQYRIVLECPAIKKSANEWRELLVTEMETVNQSMSTYINTSELSGFNQRVDAEWQAASADLLNVLLISKQIFETSEGALDPTVSPLVDAWGFGAGSKQELTRTIPSSADLVAIKDKIGFGKVIVDVANQQWRKQRVDIHVDLSAVAKGYAVDKVSEVLQKNGCQNHLVDIGGELKASGKKSQNASWRVGIEKPVLDSVRGSQLQQMIALDDVGLASSGDYRNYYEQNGRRYSHTIDPRTLAPINHTLASVTVIHEQTAVADAWATALMVLGSKAQEIAEKFNLAAYFIFRDESSEKLIFITKSTKEFDKFRFTK